MQGRNTFTQAEFDRLCQIFKERDAAESKSEQKKIRGKMRDLGFYISDFILKMDYAGFMHLYESKKIRITDSDVQATPSPKDVALGLDTPKESREMMCHPCTPDQVCNKDEHNHKEGLAPWIDDHSEILILGSLPSDISIKKQAYYQNKSNNSFWKLMHGLYGKGADSKEFLLANHVALWDCLASGNRKGSMDKCISGGEIPNNIPELLKSHPNVKRIIINGKTTPQKYFDKYFSYLYQQLDIVVVPSSSNACAMTFDDKLEEWKCILAIKR